MDDLAELHATLYQRDQALSELSAALDAARAEADDNRAKAGSIT
jgi:hypothetical protein